MDRHIRIFMFLFSGVVSGVLCRVQYISVDVRLNNVKFIKSPGFPSSCCSPQSVTIRVAPSTDTGYIRMSFDDLDLPVGSRLEVFDASGPQPALLFPDQPELVQGGWTRPALASSMPNSGIHIRFRPSKESPGGHVGYKARVWVTNSPPDKWHGKPITDQCMPVVSAFSGDRITQESLPRASPYRVIDCVWQIRMPSDHVDEELRQESLRVYARVTRLRFVGYLDIISGLSSDGEFKHEISSPVMEQLSVPRAGYTSHDGLYVHLSMVNQPGGVLEVVIGVYHSQENLLHIGGDPHLCSFGGWGRGFVCSANSRCIPDSHKCDSVSNCEDGEDEQVCTASTRPSVSTTSSTTTMPPPTSTAATTAKPFRVCHVNDAMCMDGTCDVSYTDCNEHGGRRCAYGEVFCPHLGSCINRYYFSQPCHEYCGMCDDGTCTMDGECPGECTNNQKYCEGHGCRIPYSPCPGECERWQKKCLNGDCKFTYERCEEDVCPPGYNSCKEGMKCYSDADRCDDYTDCADGSDEEDCPEEPINWHETDDGNNWLAKDLTRSYRSALWSLMVIPVILILVCVIIACNRSKRKSRHTQNECLQQESGAALRQGELHSGVRQGYTTGTRMTPVPPLNTYREVPGPESHHLMEHHGANSPHLDSGPQPSAPVQPDPVPSAPPPSYDDVVTGAHVAPPPSYSYVQ